MTIDLLQPINKIIHDTVKQAVDSDLPKKSAGVVNSFVDSIFGITEDALKKIVELTDKKTPPSPS
jgi:hypothetical protein